MKHTHAAWIAAFLFCLSANAGDSTGKIALSLRQHMEPGDQADVLVYFKKEINFPATLALEERVKRIQFVYDELRAAAEASQAEAIELLTERKARFRSFHIVNAIAVPKASLSLLQELSRISEVARIEPNAPFALKLPAISRPRQILPDDDQNIPENLKAVGADKAWSEFRARGAGIVVGGQDGGFAWRHPALREKYRGTFGLGANHNFSWHDSIHSGKMPADGCRPNSPEPCDDTGHGTHTMGTMVGDDGRDNHIGVAPDAKWIGCRNMDRGVGTPATYLECFEFFLTPYPIGGNPKTDGRPDMAPHVINNSWACPSKEGCKGHEFVDAVRALHAAGILVVAAAGNEGPGCGSVNDAPGSYSGELISTAAYDHRNGEIASFSSRGPSGWNGGIGANLAAPGALIRSSVPSGGMGDGLYDYKAGTSMASPHITGVVALLWSARPELIGKIPETITRLEQSATRKTSSQSCGKYSGGQVPNAVFGHGLVNAYEAIRRN